VAAQRNQIGRKPGVPAVRAVERSVALLRAFSPERPRRTLTELAKAAELDKGTARRILHTLVVTGLIEFDARAQLYGLSPGVLELASAVETGRDLREVAAPIMAELAEMTGATAFLWVHHDRTALCIDRARASVPNVTAWFAVGARTALNCGAGPRTLLAFISDAERAAALSGDLPRRTPLSQTDPAALDQECRLIRQRGFELAIDDFLLGLAALGIPIFNRRGALAGAISVTSLTAQIVGEGGRPRHLEMLQRAAAEIGRNLSI
jgi:DNA-binding IclR family transcriptional regulator